MPHTQEWLTLSKNSLSLSSAGQKLLIKALLWWPSHRGIRCTVSPLLFIYLTVQPSSRGWWAAHSSHASAINISICAKDFFKASKWVVYFQISAESWLHMLSVFGNTQDQTTHVGNQSSETPPEHLQPNESDKRAALLSANKDILFYFFFTVGWNEI